MDRFSFLRALAQPDRAAREGGASAHKVFSGSCCFLDEGGRLLYFLPAPQNDDCTAFSCELWTPGADAGAIAAEFDGFRLQLRAGMISCVKVVKAHMDRPPALCVALKPVAVTIQLWCESKACNATALKSVEALAQAFAALIAGKLLPCGRGEGEGSLGSAAISSQGETGREPKAIKRPEMEGERAERANEPPAKRRRASAGHNLEVLTSSCDKLNGMCRRARHSQEQVVALCLGITKIVSSLLHQPASSAAAVSQAENQRNGARPSRIPTALVDANLNTLAKTVGALHRHGAEARNNIPPARLVLQEADSMLMGKVTGPSPAVAGGCYSSATVDDDEEAEVLHRDGGRASAGSGPSRREGEGSVQQGPEDVDELLRVSQSLQVASVDLAMLACWDTGLGSHL
jgi:hypothetical protein